MRKKILLGKKLISSAVVLALGGKCRRGRGRYRWWCSGKRRCLRIRIRKRCYLSTEREADN